MRRIEFLLCCTLVVGVSLAFSLFALAQTKQTKQSTQGKVVLPSSVVARLKPLVKKNLIFLTDYQTNNLTYLSKTDDKIYLQIFGFADATAAGTQFLKEYAKYFGSTDYKKELKLQKQSLDVLGTTHLVYQQYYKNIPVFGGQMLVHMANDYGIKSASGKFLTKVSVNTKPVLNKTKAINAALADAKKRGLQSPTVASADLAIYNRRVLNPKGENKYYLTWQIELEDAIGWREVLFVNAANGKIVENLARTKSAGFFQTDYNDFLKDNILFAAFGSDKLQRRVYDCQPDGCTAASTAAGLVMTDPATLRAEGDPVYGAADVDNLYDELEKAHNYYKDVFGMNGGNSLGGIGRVGSVRHPATSTDVYAYFIATSTWGTCPNAFGGRPSLEFCDGVVNTGVVGHEYTHAVSDFIGPPTTSLAYLNESGAIEEAIADIMSQGVERNANGASSWQIGAGGSVWRDFTNPNNPITNWDFPTTHYDTEFKCDAADKGGVHTNSMVMAHMAYILSVGGELNTCKVDAIGQEAVERIFLEALDHHLTITANFQELYGALTDSCKAIYGIVTKECRNLVKAMQGAELDQPGKCVAGSVERVPLCNVKLKDPLKYLWRMDNLQDVSFTELIALPPVVSALGGSVSVGDPGLILDNDVLTNPDVGVNSGTGDNTTLDSQNPTTATTPVVTPAVEEEVRTPSFTVDVIQNGKTVTIKGKLNYYGKGAKCSGPRYFDPIIVAWGQVDTHPVLNSDNTFTSTHEYNVKNKEYDLYVRVINSCFGSYSFHKTLTFPL